MDVPDEPTSEADLLEYLRRMTFEHSAFLGHPRFYAYVSGAGTVPGRSGGSARRGHQHERGRLAARAVGGRDRDGAHAAGSLEDVRHAGRVGRAP